MMNEPKITGLSNSSQSVVPLPTESNEVVKFFQNEAEGTVCATVHRKHKVI